MAANMEYVLIASVVFAGIFVQTLAGFGSALVIMPLLVPVLGMHQAPPLMSMVAGTGMTYNDERMGPLAVADQIGLDVIVEGLERFQQAPWGGERFRPAALLAAKVEAGEQGKKSGQGFYDHLDLGLDLGW